MPLLVVLLLCLGATALPAQDTTFCHSPTQQHTIVSQHLHETRSYWVHLPLGYQDSLSYPVIYVLDAEWRFEFIRHLVFDWGANRLLPASIIVGIPHIDW